MGTETKGELVPKLHRLEEHVHWSSQGWRVLETRVYIAERLPDGSPFERLSDRAIRTEAKVGNGWQGRSEWSTDGCTALKTTILALVDELAAERQRGEDFKAALAAKKEATTP